MALVPRCAAFSELATGELALKISIRASLLPGCLPQVSQHLTTSQKLICQKRLAFRAFVSFTEQFAGLFQFIKWNYLFVLFKDVGHHLLKNAAGFQTEFFRWQ